MKRRWFSYIIIGILFGIFDFYYHGFLSNYFMRKQYFNSSLAGEIAWLVLSIGIWLVPVVLIALYEVRISQSRVSSAWASSLIWCFAIIAYYLTNAVQLALLGVPTRLELHISNRSDPFFWNNWESVLWHDIVGAILEWMVVAVVGGFIIGFLISFIYLRLRETRNV